LLALSSLERSPLARVAMTGIPAMGGFQAAYFGARHTPKPFPDRNPKLN
jgi:hypothetical protein